MMLRITARRGMDITVFSPAFNDHMDMTVASSRPRRTSFTLTRLASNADMISLVDAASFWPNGALAGRSYTGTATNPAMLPGTCAMCSASWPRLMDLACGFQASLSPGTRSSTRRVVFDSWSNSARMGSTMLMNISPVKLESQNRHFSSPVRDPAAAFKLGALFSDFRERLRARRPPALVRERAVVEELHEHLVWRRRAHLGVHRVIRFSESPDALSCVGLIHRELTECTEGTAFANSTEFPRRRTYPSTPRNASRRHRRSAFPARCPAPRQFDRPGP